MAELRRCWSCRERFPLDQFSRNNTGKDKRHRRRYICRPCNTRRRDEWLSTLSDEQWRAYISRQRRRQNERVRKRREESIKMLVTMLDRLAEWGYTTRQIAAAAGCGWDTIYRWQRHRGEGAKCVNRGTVEKVSRVFLAEVDRRSSQRN